jgi:transposase
MVPAGRGEGRSAPRSKPAVARSFGLSWSTVWSAVERIGAERLQTPAEIGPATMVGFDETVMSPASRRRRRRFVTVVVDVGSRRLLDVFEGRDAQHLRAWMARCPPPGCR